MCPSYAQTYKRNFSQAVCHVSKRSVKPGARIQQQRSSSSETSAVSEALHGL